MITIVVSFGGGLTVSASGANPTDAVLAFRHEYNKHAGKCGDEPLGVTFTRLSDIPYTFPTEEWTITNIDLED